MTVLAAKHWGTNAAMFVDVAKLWIPDDAVVLDPTYGKGGFWKKFEPEDLTAHDLCTLDGVDFRDLPHAAETFDVVTYDPAYVVPGGRKTSTVKKFNEQYGMDTTEPTLGRQWAEVIVPGATECVRVLKRGGLLMWKCQNYISSASYHNYRQGVTERMLLLGHEQVDEFIFVRKTGGMQPKDRRRACPRSRLKSWRRCDRGIVKVTEDRLEMPCPVCDGEGDLPSIQAHSRNNASFLIIGRKK